MSAGQGIDDAVQTYMDVAGGIAAALTPEQAKRLLEWCIGDLLAIANRLERGGAPRMADDVREQLWANTACTVGAFWDRRSP